MEPGTEELQSTRHSRNIEWEDPAPYLPLALELEPVEYMQRMATGEIPYSPIAALMNFTDAEVERGRVVFEARADDRHLNPIGLVHGGLAATLLDSAMGCAIHTVLPRGGGYSTIQLNVHYTRAIPNGETVRCEGRVIHSGRKIATAEGTIRDSQGRVVAHGTTTCAVMLPPAGS